VRYAAYGSNLHPLRLGLRTPSAALLGTDVLEGHALAFVKRGRDGSGKCTIARAAGAQVYLAVFEIDDAERGRLDAFEGRGRGYEVETLELPRLGRCETYVAQPAHLDPALQPFTWYRELVLVGGEAHGFPGAYLERIAAVAAREDRDRARHEEHMTIVRRARGGR
jgi:hypothetical protein